MRTATFKIVAVEDDADDRMLLDEAFLAIGAAADIKKLADGAQLMHYLDTVEQPLYPSLIVLDNSLPGSSALELLVTLKASTRYGHIPVVIYTTLVSPAAQEALMAAGAFACRTKGLTMKEIIATAHWFKQLAEGHLHGDVNHSTTI
ncbi:response regulator [Paraflavitalea pollutisoli]|uniref:response regulator n=1 Tax=Paraflavitalea pollutisoli TaxID=3034143 RepID=UPI0023EAE68B|nr:response regulator [Paraflavitalea sp. H1-2-19X]